MSIGKTDILVRLAINVYKMKKFFVLYGIPVKDLDEWMAKPEEERKAGEKGLMENWQAWADEHKAMFVDPGKPLGKTKRATGSGVTDVRNDYNWYAIVEGNSHEEVAAIFATHPQLKDIPSAYIEIMTMRDAGM